MRWCSLALILSLICDLTCAVRPIRPRLQGRLKRLRARQLRRRLNFELESNEVTVIDRAAHDYSAEDISSGEDEDDNSVGDNLNCPARCLCYKTTVRCLFLKLKLPPDAAQNSTLL